MIQSFWAWNNYMKYFYLQISLLIALPTYSKKRFDSWALNTAAYLNDLGRLVMSWGTQILERTAFIFIKSSVFKIKAFQVKKRFRMTPKWTWCIESIITPLGTLRIFSNEQGPLIPFTILVSSKPPHTCFLQPQNLQH